MKDEKGPERDLRERTKQFALKIIGLYSALPKQDTVAQTIGKQFLRSGTSVGANYREAYRSRSDVEFVAKIGICLQELDETGYWLELLAEVLKNLPDLPILQDEIQQLLAIFTVISKKSKARL